MANLFRSKLERRRETRSHTTQNVYLYWPGRLSCRQRVTSLSPSGAFIDVGPLRVPEGVRLELAFVLRRGGIIKMIRRSAIVVRRAEEGLGLMFVKQPDAIQPNRGYV
jgi:hypothetical protein